MADENGIKSSDFMINTAPVLPRGGGLVLIFLNFGSMSIKTAFNLSGLRSISFREKTQKNPFSYT